jgi:hypothetical protein
VSDETLVKNGGFTRGWAHREQRLRKRRYQPNSLGKRLEQGKRDRPLVYFKDDELEYEVLVMSTGVTGVNLDIGKVIVLLPLPLKHLPADFSSWERFGKSFMTTDTFHSVLAYLSFGGSNTA